MSNWPSAKAKKVLAALQSIGWRVKRQSGSHKTLELAYYPDYVFVFHDGEEIGPKMLSRIAKHTGLEPGDL
jgi:predicted RNA binding protein YcfA (HicA-like mRNA interferase family)